MNQKFKAVLLLFLLPFFAFAQSVITGTVYESNGLPALGATVSVKGTSNGTSTDFDGKYTLNNVPSDAVIVFSFLGYTTQEIPLNGQTVINLTLQEDASELDTIVLIGYGSTTKANVTAAQTTVKSKEFNKGAIVAPGQLLAGKAAGVQVTAPSGQPGGGPVIRVRAGSTLSASQEPLIVVDGIPLDQANANLNTINPADIESYSILKDASATAIYGNRASNGVIIITTKSGTLNSDWKVDYDFQFAVNNNYNDIDVLSAPQLRDLATQQGRDLSLFGEANTDWQDEIYQTGTRGIHNFNVSKGWESTQMRVSFSNTGEEGTLKTSDYSRTTLGLNVTQRLLNNDLKLRLTSQGAVENIGSADQGAIGSAVVFDPTQPVRDPNGLNGFYEHFTNGILDVNAPRNPLGLLESFDEVTKNNQIRMNLNAEYKLPVDGLKFVGNAGFDYNEFDRNTNRLSNSGAGLNSNGFRGFEDGLRRNVSLNGRFDYKKDLEKLNTVMTATLGASYQKFTRTSTFNNTVDGVFSEDDRKNFSENALISQFARVSFDIKDRFVISASGSRDGSSRFVEDERYGYFGGVSGAIKLTNTNFIQNSGFLSRLKLRGGYGLTGNQEFGQDFSFIQVFTPGLNNASIQFGNEFVNTIRPEGTEELVWETTKMWNAGIDYGFFDDRVTGSVDAYYRDTEDLILFGPFADGGLENQGFQNSGDTRSRGLEFALNVKVFEGEDFNWDLGGNFTLQDLEITNLVGQENDPVPQGGISGGVGNTIQEWAVGSDPTAFHVYRQVYDDAGNPLNGVYVDVNGDNIINEQDRVRYKKATPDAFFGLTSNMTYKNAFFSFTLRGSLGGYNYNNVDSNNANLTAAFDTPGNYFNNSTTGILNTGFSDQELFSDYYVQSSDFLRLDNATIGYNWDREVVDLRFSLTGVNLFTITDYEGLDPEVFGGIDNNLYPRSRGIILGIGATF